MIWVIRLIHTFLALIGLAAIVTIYLSAISQTYNMWLYLSLGALLVEIIAVRLNGCECPFLFFSRRYGDNKKLLELFLPKNVAKQMFKVIFIVIVIGYLLLLFRFLFWMVNPQSPCSASRGRWVEVTGASTWDNPNSEGSVSIERTPRPHETSQLALTPKPEATRRRFAPLTHPTA